MYKWIEFHERISWLTYHIAIVVILHFGQAIKFATHFLTSSKISNMKLVSDWHGKSIHEFYFMVFYLAVPSISVIPPKLNNENPLPFVNAGMVRWRPIIQNEIQPPARFKNGVANSQRSWFFTICTSWTNFMLLLGVFELEEKTVIWKQLVMMGIITHFLKWWEIGHLMAPMEEKSLVQKLGSC